MLCSDRIIVLGHTRYSDSSIVVQALSRQRGRLALMVFGIGKNKSRLGAFHPMSLLDVVYVYKAERQVQKLSEYKPSPPLASCIADLRKSTLLMFIAEVVSKSIREEASDDNQFSFIDTSVQMLEQMSAGLQYFHLAFMVKLSRFLGFMPDNVTNSQLPYFDLEKGYAVGVRPPHRNYVATEVFAHIATFADYPYSQLSEVPLSTTDRNFLLETVIRWYGFHVPSMRDINAYDVLHDVFN